MSPEEQNKNRNYLLRRIDPETLKTIIENNFDFAKKEWVPDYTLHDFRYGIATIIVEDLHNYDYIDLNQDLEIYNRLINYFYIVLENKSRKLFNKLNDDYNNQEEHIIEEEFKIPLPILRRIPPNDLEEMFYEAVGFGISVYEKRAMHLSLNEGIQRFIEYVMGRLIFFVENEIYEDVKWDKTGHMETYNKLKEYFLDRIIEIYRNEFVEN